MRAFIGFAAFLCAGCASTPEVRGLADKTGHFVSSLQSGTNDFIESQNRLNGQNAARLDHLVALQSPARAAVRQQRLAWTDAGDRVRLSMEDAAIARSAEDIIAGLETKATSSPEVSAPSYEKTLKALADVAAKPKATVALRELIGFGQEVYAKYGELQEKAKKDAEATDPASNATDKKTENAAKSVEH